MSAISTGLVNGGAPLAVGDIVAQADFAREISQTYASTARTMLK